MTAPAAVEATAASVEVREVRREAANGTGSNVETASRMETASSVVTARGAETVLPGR